MCILSYAIVLLHNVILCFILVDLFNMFGIRIQNEQLLYGWK